MQQVIDYLDQRALVPDFLFVARTHIHRHCAMPTLAFRTQFLEERSDVLTTSVPAYSKDLLGQRV
jgi:hypothetical protein